MAKLTSKEKATGVRATPVGPVTTGVTTPAPMAPRGPFMAGVAMGPAGAAAKVRARKMPTRVTSGGKGAPKMPRRKSGGGVY